MKQKLVLLAGALALSLGLAVSIHASIISFPFTHGTGVQSYTNNDCDSWPSATAIGEHGEIGYNWWTTNDGYDIELTIDTDNYSSGTYDAGLCWNGDDMELYIG